MYNEQKYQYIHRYNDGTVAERIIHREYVEQKPQDKTY